MVLLDIAKSLSIIPKRIITSSMVGCNETVTAKMPKMDPLSSKKTAPKFIHLDSTPENHAVNQAESVLRSGGIVAVPTDTIYGVASLLSSFQKLYHLKRRSPLKPLAICVGSVEQISKFAHVTVPLDLLHALLPGPVTVVLPRLQSLPTDFNPECSSVGIRVPKSSFMNRLCQVCDQPLALTSANLSNAQSSLSVQEFDNLWPEIDMIVDGGILDSKSRDGSTVVDFCTLGYYSILRNGSAFEETSSILQKPEFEMKML